MKALFALLLAGVACGFESDYEAFSEMFVNYHNSLPYRTWEATTENFKNVPSKYRRNYIRRLCGVRPGPPESQLSRKWIEVDDIPDSFDARERWSECPTLREIRDQGACGSCYVFGAVEAASDRLCIQSGGKINTHLSAEQVVSCCKTCGFGCSGGFPGLVWRYFESSGVVTGGPWHSNQGCYPYEVKACDHHVVGKLSPCKGIGPTPECKTSCEKGYNVSFNEDKHYGSTVYSVFGEKQIQTEIMTNGPVEAAFNVYEDFPLYKSGVYSHTSGRRIGGHAVKILGWGIEQSSSGKTPYWLVANSWNPDWGDKGFFKIRRGNNECNIESGIVAGMMKVE